MSEIYLEEHALIYLKCVCEVSLSACGIYLKRACDLLKLHVRFTQSVRVIYSKCT